MPNNPNNWSWFLPSLAGMLLAVIRRFRRSAEEKVHTTLLRFLSHVLTCIFAGYVTSGILYHLDFPKLVAPCCALAGLYGTVLVDYLESDGIAIIKAYIQMRIFRRK